MLGMWGWFVAIRCWTVFFSMSHLISLHYQDYYYRLEQKGQNALVLFSSSRCGTCRAWKKKIERTSWNIKIFEVDVTAAQGLVEELSIHVLPTFVLYKEGSFHRFFSPDMRLSIEQQVMEALSLPQQEDPTC